MILPLKFTNKHMHKNKISFFNMLHPRMNPCYTSTATPAVHTYICMYILHTCTYTNTTIIVCMYVCMHVCTYIQGFKKDQEEDNIRRVTDKGWNSQKQLSHPVEQKKKEKTPVSSS